MLDEPKRLPAIPEALVPEELRARFRNTIEMYIAMMGPRAVCEALEREYNFRVEFINRHVYSSEGALAQELATIVKTEYPDWTISFNEVSSDPLRPHQFAIRWNRADIEGDVDKEPVVAKIQELLARTFQKYMLLINVDPGVWMETWVTKDDPK